MFGFILNFPFTIIGLVSGLISLPTSITLRKNPYAFILNVRTFRWYFWGRRKARAITVGHTVLLSPKIEEHDLEHELIHVRQYEKFLFLFPFLYYYESFRKDYRNNKFEDEAFRISGSVHGG